MEQDKWTFSLQICFDAWRDWINEAEHEGKGTFINEHVNWMVRPDVESHFFHGDHKPHSNQRERGFNPTCTPDHFLLCNVRPTSLIRHPALTFPSLIRTAIDNEGIGALLTSSAENKIRWEATYYWHTTLYKFYLALSTYPCPSKNPSVTYPIILAASDLSRPEVVRKYAAVVGLEPDVGRFEWAESSAEGKGGVGAIEARMKDTLMRSVGVMREKLEETV
jgi:hypothetical protein